MPLEYNVTVVDNLLTQRYSSLFNIGRPITFIDKCISEITVKDLANIDVVIHLAAITDAAGSFENKTQTENINLTGNITVVGTVYPTTITAAGSTGSSGQILSSTGSGLQWVNSPAQSCCGLDDVLTIGNSSSQDIILNGGKFSAQGVGGAVAVSSPATLDISGVSTFSNNVNILNTTVIFNPASTITAGGTVGSAGEWLVSTGTGVEWSSTIPSGTL
jgi:hypothetical protein